MRVQADIERLHRFVDGVAPLGDELRAGAMQLECALASYGEDVALAQELRAHADAAATLGDFVSLVVSRFEEAEGGGWTFSYADASAAAYFGGAVFRSAADVSDALDATRRQLFKPGSQIGSGSTSDALRFELEHEVRFRSRSGHLIKVEQSIERLQRIRRSPHLTPLQQAEIDRLLHDLRDARESARQLARTRGKSPHQMVRDFRRVDSPEQAMRTSGVPGLAGIASAMRATIGYLASPFILLAPASLLESPQPEDRMA